MCETPQPGQRWLRTSSGGEYDVLLVVKDFFSQSPYIVYQNVRTEEVQGMDGETFTGVNPATRQPRFTLLSSTCKVGCGGCVKGGEKV